MKAEVKLSLGSRYGYVFRDSPTLGRIAAYLESTNELVCGYQKPNSTGYIRDLRVYANKGVGSKTLSISDYKAMSKEEIEEHIYKKRKAFGCKHESQC
jgi:hypothetical protein